MFTKVILLAATVLLASQAMGVQKNAENRKVGRELVEIANNTYFIDAQVGYHRDEAKDLCASMNLTLVSFDGDDKWRAVNKWMNDNDYGFNWFWTDALRDDGSPVWYWETTGENLTDFYWGSGQPTMDNNLVRTCINFSYFSGGYDDDDCTNFFLDVLCE